MWVLSMINLPTLVLAFLYAVSWSEGWEFFSDELPAFQLQAQEDTSQGLVWPRHGRAVLLLWVMDLLGLPWPRVWLWHFMSALLGVETPPHSPHESCTVCHGMPPPLQGLNKKANKLG